MFPSIITQQFAKIATLVYNDLSKDNDFIFMKRSKILEGCDSNIPQFLVIIYGRFTESPKALFITLDQEQNLKLENLMKIFYEKLLLNLHKITDGKVTKLVLGNCEYYVFLQEYPTKESLEDSKFEGLCLLTKDNENYLIPKEPVQHSSCIPILSALISCSKDSLEKHEIHGNNLLEVKFHGKPLRNLNSVSNPPNEPTCYELPCILFYNSLEFRDIIASRKDCGIFLMRYASLKFFNEDEYKEQIAKSLDEVKSTIKFLISDTIAFEDICKIREDVHEVLAELHNGILTWLRSSNSTESLQEFIFNTYINENENIDNSIKILHGLPGCGKSTYLKKIAKDLQTEDATRWINFLDGSVLEHILHLDPDLFSKSCTEVLYQLFQIKNNWEKLVFHYGSQILGRIVCLIDNFDDMPKSILPNFAQFLKQVNEEYPKIVFWITARTEFKDIILKHVPIFSHNLPVFNKEEKMKFLKGILSNIDDDALKDILQKIEDENDFFTSAFDVISKFDVTPYDLWLCSEKVKRYGKDTSLYLLDVYDFYVEQKMNEVQENDLEELCRSAAFNYVKSSQNVYIDLPSSTLFGRVFGNYKDRKILMYLTALFFSKNEKNLTKEFMFNQDLEFIIYLLNGISFRKFPLGRAVLNGRLDKILILTETEDAKLIRDNFGRNLAHIVRDEHSDILEHLLKKGVSLDEEDNILHWTPKQYSVARKENNNIEIMLKNKCKMDELRKLPQFNDDDTEFLFEKQFNEKHFEICKLILDSHRFFKITPSLVYCVTKNIDDESENFVLRILNMAKDQKLNEQPEYLNTYRENAIYNVITSNYLEIMKILVEDLKYNVRCKNSFGNEPVSMVTNVDLLDYMIKKGADPYFTNSNYKDGNIFFNACLSGNFEIVKYFIEVLKIDESSFNECDTMPLYLSAHSENPELFQYLVEHGFMKSKNSFNDTALHTACNYGYFEIVKFLVEKGEDINYVGRYKNKPIDNVNPQESEDKLKIYNYLLERGATNTMEHLYHLIDSKNYELFRKMIDLYPVDWNYYNPNGYTLLQHTVMYTTEEDIIRLIGTKSDLEYLSETERATALHLAFSKQSTKAVQVLLDLGANLQAKTENGETMFHFAMKYPEENLLKILLNHGLDINAKDNNGRSPVHVLSQSYCGSLAKYLIDNGMDVNSVDNDGLTALLEIYVNNNCYAREWVDICLRDLKINPHIRDRRGRMALHYAVENNNFPLILLHAKHTILDVDAEDENGETPLSLSQKLNNVIIHDFLLKCKLNQENLD